ncbi:GDYXXLXY domain-containing protein [Bacillus massiliigorillae]|uniref:GDYXXLXY domain-containing protein n=1 Tax=Bacillus massiliigorillae TaxID=1243664 RepID=UPI00039FF9F1|nr:GDYXXLXY domain-containing protein [Bacillus massiliigorillae]
MKPSLKKFLLILIVPLLILLGMVIKPVSAYMFGERIVLETIPVDPTSLFYGDYMSLQLKISEVPKELLSESLMKELISHRSDEYSLFSKTIPVYTALEKKGDIYRAKAVSLDKPKNGLYLKGKINSYILQYDQQNLYVDYGIDRYYVEENTGKEIENHAQQGNIKVALKIKNGYGLIDGLVY